MPKRRTDKASKALRGLAKGSGMSEASESVPTHGNSVPERPATLTGRAAEIWSEYAPGLALQGMLTERDRLAFTLWCQLGAKVESGELSAALVSQFRLLSNDFGCTPSGKGRELSAPRIAAAPAARHRFFND